MKKITVETKPAQQTKGAKEAMFVSFTYDMETVEKIKSLPTRYYTPSTKSWEVPTRYLPQLIEVFSGYNIVLHGPVNSKVKTAVEKAAPTFDNVDYNNFTFKTAPFNHQIEAFEYAKTHNRFLLADEQGLGKTKQSIDIAVARKGQFKHCLIVCGVNSTKFNWQQEVETHSNERAFVLGTRFLKNGKKKDGTVKDRVEDLCNRNEFFLITNIETLRNKDFQEKAKELTQKGTIGMVIVDEIHKAKNAQSQQGKAIHHLKPYYRIALTGTPLMNTPLDLFNILKWLGEETGAFYRFKNRYCIMGGFGGYEVVGYKNLEELKTRLDKVQLRRKKDEVLDLPPKIRQTEYVELTGKQAQLYKAIKNELLQQLDEIMLDPNPLAQLIRLRQVTGHPGILDHSIEDSAKMERLYELVQENVESGKKTIIFSNWTKMTEPAKQKLAEFNPAYVVGGSDVQSEVTKFQNDPSCMVIIGTIPKLGTGLTLTAASTVIFLDKPWNMANTEQAEDRAHRIGTTGTVNVITLVAKDTIDERIEELVEQKGKMSDALVDGKFGNLDKAETLNFLLS